MLGAWLDWSALLREAPDWWLVINVGASPIRLQWMPGKKRSLKSTVFIEASAAVTPYA